MHLNKKNKWCQAVNNSDSKSDSSAVLVVVMTTTIMIIQIIIILKKQTSTIIMIMILILISRSRPSRSSTNLMIIKLKKWQVHVYMKCHRNTVSTSLITCHFFIFEPRLTRSEFYSWHWCMELGARRKTRRGHTSRPEVRGRMQAQTRSHSWMSLIYTISNIDNWQIKQYI